MLLVEPAAAGQFSPVGWIAELGEFRPGGDGFWGCEVANRVAESPGGVSGVPKGLKTLDFVSAGGGTRTRTDLSVQRILSSEHHV